MIRGDGPSLHVMWTFSVHSTFSSLKHSEQTDHEDFTGLQQKNLAPNEGFSLVSPSSSLLKPGLTVLCCRFLLQALSRDPACPSSHGLNMRSTHTFVPPVPSPSSSGTAQMAFLLQDAEGIPQGILTALGRAHTPHRPGLPTFTCHTSIVTFLQVHRLLDSLLTPWVPNCCRCFLKYPYSPS